MAPSYVGSGNEGQVYRWIGSGTGRVFFDTDELEVHAIVLRHRAAGSTSAPRRTARSTRSTLAATAPSSSIRPTGTSGASSSITPATSSPPPATRASIYRITPDGKGTPFYQTKATHAMTLAFDRDGSPARRHGVARHACSASTRPDKPFVLLDSAYNEIHALRIDPTGNIYAAAVWKRRPARCASRGRAGA